MTFRIISCNDVWYHSRHFAHSEFLNWGLHFLEEACGSFECSCLVRPTLKPGHACHVQVTCFWSALQGVAAARVGCGCISEQGARREPQAGPRKVYDHALQTANPRGSSRHDCSRTSDFKPEVPVVGSSPKAT